jgi:hypothetical protein
MHSGSDMLCPASSTAQTHISLYRLSGSGSDEESRRRSVPTDKPLAGREELPFQVELWDDAKRSVEQVLAVTINASIGYAAYYAATREYPHRYITLRHRNGIISRWNGPEH